MFTLENLLYETEELTKLGGSALLKRLLEVHLPVTLDPFAYYTDSADESLYQICKFILVAVPKKQTKNKLESCQQLVTNSIKNLCGKIAKNSNEKANANADSTNKNANEHDADDANKIEFDCNFLLSIGNGKFLKMVNVEDAYFGKIGVDTGSSEITCEANWLHIDDEGNPEPGFLFTFLPHQSVDNLVANEFVIQSKLNGKYLGNSAAEHSVLCADYKTIEKATKFKLGAKLHLD